MPRRFPNLIAFACVSGLIAGCDSTEPRGPGSIFISSSASNPEPNSQFYQYDIIVDNGTPRPSFVYEDVNLIINGLAAGAHEVRLAGVPTACNIGENPRPVSLRGDDTALVVFSIQCPRTTGDLQVTVATTGSDHDPNGYVLLLGNLGSIFIPTSFSQLLQFFPAGTHSISLADVATNCTAGPPQSITVTPGQTSTVSIQVTCTPVATVKVVATTTGTERDADGFTVTLGANDTRVLVNGTTHLRAPNGTINWSVSDVQPNCALGGASSGSLTVAAGDTGTVTIDATCGDIGYGTAGTVVTEAAGDTLTNGGSSNAAHDFLQLTARYATDWLILVLRFSRPVGSVGGELPTALYGVIDLDTDENASTGAAPFINGFGGSASMGSDYRVDLFLSGPDGARLLRFQSGETDEQLAPMTLEGDSVVIKIPLAKLGGDDGRLVLSGLFGTADRPTDLMPNTGAIVARPATALLAGARAIKTAEEGPIRKGVATWPATGYTKSRP